MSAALAQDSAPASAQTPVDVNAYTRNYESPKTPVEQNFDSSIWQAYANKESQVGNMEGEWVVTDASGQKLIGLELRSDGVSSGKLDGAWRSMVAGYGLNESGFVSHITLTGRDLEVNYFADKSRSPTVLEVHKDSDGQWRGDMLATDGQETPIIMSAVNPAS